MFCDSEVTYRTKLGYCKYLMFGVDQSGVCTFTYSLHGFRVRYLPFRSLLWSFVSILHASVTLGIHGGRKYPSRYSQRARNVVRWGGLAGLAPRTRRTWKGGSAPPGRRIFMLLAIRHATTCYQCICDWNLLIWRSEDLKTAFCDVGY